mmetsp:Transcript_261/g.472  ORF Transcript_261/g.472 Transcript_261/m.472 type:complete len:535 (-) Transcript_261:205-1809(-)|eukprot:CAMPEP_0185024242 /NCGR_PEP_ID=MMETSP1103-20130426/7231_1 /TAXON_ID=36769 /ORGANISM="Paraphysomonas bandaiensis, Strain Caron Lab Isolate" /LENGTH=534 /DNA_ID=CAMNT_0027557161 /DNA_START=66 /DNA_END=1670 /DNA_ORIENTATION=+
MIQRVLTAAVIAVSAAQEELLVKTSSGLVQGHYNELNVREWNGIPFAAPPVGDLRYEQSVPPQPWEDTYDASFMAPGCPQICKLPPGNCPEYGISEDCLYLSVWSPTEPSPDPEGYPVYFWIHGGAYEQGLGDCALYNGTNYATLGVVSVAINYRLGSFGFMASESMEGNYGILDQRLALQWTLDNIAGFGGNPKRVTIGGQSAGAMSVGVHMTAKGSKGMFQQAVMESNPLALPMHTRESATANANAVFEYVGCPDDDVACMRTKSVDELLEAQNEAPTLNLDNLFINFLPWSPLVEEGGEIEEQPFTALAGGKIDPMTLMSGTVKDEGQLFVFELFTKPLSKAAYEATILGVFGAHSYKQIMKKYPYDLVEGADDGRASLNVLATDLLFYCPLRNATRGYQRALGAEATPTYIYRFDHVMSFDCWGPDYWFCVGYVCHGSELPFEFNVFTDGVSVDYDPNADEEQLTVDLADMWTNFIANANPNKGLPTPAPFPLYGERTDEILVMEEPGSAVMAHQRETYCDMWDKMGYFY